MSAVTTTIEKHEQADLNYDTSGSPLSIVTSGDELSLYAEAINHQRSVELGSTLGRRLTDLQNLGYVFCKRVLDVGISLTALILLSPVFLFAAILVKWHDRGPVFFSQERVGRNGRTFRCFKFRSMKVNAQALQKSLMEQSKHADPRTFKMANDPRITPPGRLLRRYSIDELPQIVNVLLGDMSIVGPRPPLPSETKLYTPSDYRRLEVKPGLTCLWQVSGRSRLPFPEQVKLDVEYIERRSLLLDLVIILRTVPAVLTGDGAE